MPKYPVGYLRVESVRHESVRADSRKRLNSSSQRLDPEARSQCPCSPTSQCAGTVARVVACRTGRRRRARSRTPGAWARLSRASAAAAAPPSTVVRARALRGGSAAGTRDRVGSTRCRLVESPNDGRTRRTATAIARNRPGGRPGTGATSSTAPGAPARPARRHGVSDVSRDRGGLRRPSLAQERAETAESGPTDETARSRTAAERRRR